MASSLYRQKWFPCTEYRPRPLITPPQHHYLQRLDKSDSKDISRSETLQNSLSVNQEFFADTILVPLTAVYLVCKGMCRHGPGRAGISWCPARARAFSRHYKFSLSLLFLHENRGKLTSAYISLQNNLVNIQQSETKTFYSSENWLCLCTLGIFSTKRSLTSHFDHIS